MSNEEEKERIHREVVNWINENDGHFKENCRILYDKENLERIKRFAGAPTEYINERIELNKEVSRSYHKLHTTIILAGFTAVYAVFLTQTVNSLVNTREMNYTTWLNIALLIFLVISVFIAPKIHLTYRLLKFIGLLRVIRDSEIEIYYLTKIKEYRELGKQKKPEQ